MYTLNSDNNNEKKNKSEREKWTIKIRVKKGSTECLEEKTKQEDKQKKKKKRASDRS